MDCKINNTNMNKDDLYTFKQELVIAGDTVFYYRLIGSNLLFVHDTFDETVQVMDDELDSSEHCVVYPESRFFEEYGGFHMGTDDVSIEDLIKIEWAMILDNEKSDRAVTAAQLKSFNSPVSASSFNFELN
jgi:hypothetical protein